MGRPWLSTLTTAALSLAAALVAVPPPAAAQDEFSDAHSLAAHSLLLDVTRSGDRYVAVGERGHVVWSDDLAEWTQAESVPTRATLTVVRSVGDRLWAAGHDSVIIFSDDGGANWTLSHSDPDRQQPIMDLHFSDPDNGIVIGAYGLILKTGDGGRTWEDDYVNDEDDFHLNRLLVLPSGRWLIAGEAGYSYFSDDEGQTWQPLDLPYQGSMFGALQNGGCVLFYGLRGHAQQSCDNGETWDEVGTGTDSTLSDAAGSGSSMLLVGNGGTLVEWDGDSGFSEQVHSSGAIFSAVWELPGGEFLLVGEDGFHRWPEAGSEGESP